MPGTERLPPGFRERIAAIPVLDGPAMAAARARHDTLTKPPGSLGRLEALAVQIAGMTANPRPRLPHKAVIVAAADHGVTTEGVSAYPAAVTGQMVRNFLAGGAAINVLARQAGARVVVVDFGVASPLPDDGRLVRRAIRPGTRNFAREPALTPGEVVAALEAGAAVLDDEAEAGLDLIATGEMGIGNTTAAAAVVAAFTGVAAARVVGRGTGLDDDAWRHKVEVVERALALHRPGRADALDVLSKVGGLEIAGLAGVIIAAAARRIPVVLDGYITAAAAMAAASLAPAAGAFLLPSHRSVEPGHQVALDALALEPLFDLHLRLGEGTGATLAFPLIDAALAVLDEMATFAEAGVSGPSDE